MSEGESPSRSESPSRRQQMKAFLTAGWDKGIAKSKEELLKGQLYLKHQVGLGHQPNVVPPGKPDPAGPPRPVEVGWHPVAGFAGKWFADESGLGKMITSKINHYPDPTQHWAVLVGEYCHQLWMDEHFDVIYINEKINRDEWQTFEVGRTRFNDEALRQASEMTIFHMRQKKAAYNLINNNCQNFALALLDAIQVGRHKEFATSLAVYKTAMGKGKIIDLFAPEEGTADPTQTNEEADAEHDNVMQHAQNVLQENTSSISIHNPR